MSEPNLISPMLDNFAMGGPISDHDGVRCYPAMENDTDGKYIVKIISIPASQTQLDALLLSGAYTSKDAALTYFKELADSVVEEVNILESLSKMEGFLPFEACQCVTMDDLSGYNVYLLGTYKRTLAKQFVRQPLTQLQAVNMGLDLCAALAVARRAGYLYIDMKPNNVYVTENNEFRIGDLGFIKLDSLKYASFPEKYRSQYTAPEIADAFSSLNKTLDIYSVGLILYQAYNNGALPFDSDAPPAEAFPAPAYADYEISEIILKACAPNPDDRWQDPIEMGQALISYMQRNGVNDTPIVPPAKPAGEETQEEVPVASSGQLEENTSPETEGIESEQGSESGDRTNESDGSDESDSPASESPGRDAEADSDGDSNYEDLSSLIDDETDPENVDINYDEVSDEVSEILSQADELMNHDVPKPAVAPDPIEVTLPEPEEEEPEQTDDSEAVPDPEEEMTEEPQEDSTAAEKPRRHWLRNSLIVFAAATVIVGGMYFYKNYYLLSVDGISLEGSEDTLTVHVTSQLDESKLSVVCSDTYGTKSIAKVKDGAAVFTDLVPNTGYTVNVVVDGFHKLVGNTSTAYSTPVQTNIVQYSAVTGSESGSVILSFTPEGPDSAQWQVTYSAEGEEEQTVTFPSHMVTLTGLTVGKEYTFRITPEDDLYVTGTDEITYTASNLIYAENLAINSLENNTLTASWTVPEGIQVDSWTVRCYNTDVYNETQITSETSAVFENLDSAQSYTVEVTAAGMSVAQRTYVSENAATFRNVQTDLTAEGDLIITWETDSAIPENGWVITYSIDGSSQQETLTCTENKAVISPAVPEASYSFSVQDVNGQMILGFPTGYKMAEAAPFTCTYGELTVNAEDIGFKMAKRPNRKSWNRYHLSSSDYRDTFEVGEKAVYVAKIHGKYGESEDTFLNTFVIRREDGTVVKADSVKTTWEEMWHSGYGEMDIPSMPEEAGNYTMSVYFNGALAHEQNFTVK